MTIHMIHGCYWDPSGGENCTRNYLSEERLRRYLEHRDCKYERLGDLEESDALTIDDSTYGAARACTIARECEHEVTLFVNPAQVERDRLYWFSRLDALLDKRTANVVRFRCREYGPSREDLRNLRLDVKSILMSLDENDIDPVLDEVSSCLGAEDTDVPEHYQTLSVPRLTELQRIGVHIESHGWDHRDISSMTNAELQTDIALSQKWFEHNLAVHPVHYAIPYGLALPRSPLDAFAGLVLRADSRTHFGLDNDAGCWNRKDLTATLKFDDNTARK